MPPAVTSTEEPPELNNSSFACVVVTLPLFIPRLVPVATVCVSSGLDLSTPEYSWTYTSAQPLIAVANAAVTVFAPPATFLA